MNKKEEQILRDEIHYEERHQELDKFNFDIANSNFVTMIFMLLSIIIGLSALIMGMRELDIQLRIFLILITLLIILYYANKIKKEHGMEIEKTRKHFKTREEMIEDRLKKIYPKIIDPTIIDKLKTEFTDIYSKH